MTDIKKIQLNEEQRLVLRGLRGQYSAEIERNEEGWALLLKPEVKMTRGRKKADDNS